LPLYACAQTDAHVTSELKNIQMATANHLPAVGGGAGGPDRFCERMATIRSAGAKWIKERGWLVMSDVSLGPYRVVSFVGESKFATSGACVNTQGHIAVFKNNTLFALAWGTSPDEPLIGHLQSLEGAGVRVWDGNPVPNPVGDLRANADGTLRLAPVSSEDTVCHGHATVPNVYHMPIDKARTALLSKGWRPVRGTQTEGDAGQAGLIKRGMIETQACAGTGFAFCEFRYTSPTGKLVLTTAGEEDYPRVTDYDVTCR
jgi:hypothetical protein